tara:strand:- start:1489 stop:1899 length:411 start_codon:yes stop_codon:yes gene_type:complete
MSHEGHKHDELDARTATKLAKEVDARISSIDEQLHGQIWGRRKAEQVVVGSGTALNTEMKSPTVVKQVRYELGNGEDLIDKWARDYTRERFRHVMWAMIDKYNCRLGKKAPIPEETAKMKDYMSRWHEYEVLWASE